MPPRAMLSLNGPHRRFAIPAADVRIEDLHRFDDKLSSRTDWNPVVTVDPAFKSISERNVRGLGHPATANFFDECP